MTIIEPINESWMNDKYFVDLRVEPLKIPFGKNDVISDRTEIVTEGFDGLIEGIRKWTKSHYSVVTLKIIIKDFETKDYPLSKAGYEIGEFIHKRIYNNLTVIDNPGSIIRIDDNKGNLVQISDRFETKIGKIKTCLLQGFYQIHFKNGESVKIKLLNDFEVNECSPRDKK